MSASVSSGDHSGSIGAGGPGGIAFDFEGVQRDASLYVDYVVPGTYDAWEVFFGGEARLQDAFQNIGATSQDNWQLWNLELLDNAGDVPFEDVELTFEYDESLLGAPWATMAEIEAQINVYQYDDSDGAWKPLQLVDRDTTNNQLTVVADGFSTFVLGHGVDAPPPSSDNAELQFGVFESDEAGEGALTAFIEVDLTQPALHANSRVYAKLPGGSDYLPVEGWFFANDHDGDHTTPTINQGRYDLDLPQGDMTDAEFFAAIDGTWTVLVDVNGGPSVVEDANDIKFTFDVNGTNANALPPKPTITSPSDGATIDVSGLELAWTVAAGSMTGVTVEAEVEETQPDFQYYEATSITGQTAQFPELPSETPLMANVRHIKFDAGYVGAVTPVSGFETFDWDGDSGLIASVDTIELVTGVAPFSDYDVEFDVISANYDGEDLLVAFLDVTIATDTVGPATKVQFKQPGVGSFIDLEGGPYGDAYFDFLPAAGQTTTNFLQSFTGDYDVRVDFEGDGEFDVDFTLTLDFAALTSAAIPAAPTGLTPAEDTVIAAGTRSVTLNWNAVTAGDRIETSVNFFEGELDLLNSSPFVDQGGPLSQTSQQFDRLPTNTDLVAIVLAEDDRSELADGDGEISVTFLSGATANFTIESEVVNVAAGDSLGQFAGGADVIGGVGFDFTGVATAADLNFDYYSTDEHDARQFLLGDGADMIWQDFQTTHQNVFQLWTPSLTDDNGDVAFNTIDVTLAYDPTQLGNGFLNAQQVEDHLYVYQWNASSNHWEHLPLLGRDAANDTITVRTDLLSPIVLGVDQNGPGLIEETLVEVEAAIFQAVFGGEAELFVSLSIETADDSRYGPNTVLHVTTPVDSSPRVFAGYGNLIWTEIESDGRSLTDFIVALDGDYDFGYDFDGNGSIDEELTITLDTTGLSAADFPAALTPTFPANNAVLTANQREVEVQWSATTADRVGVEVYHAPSDAYVFAGETEGDSLTTSLLPTGLPLNVGLAAIHYRPNRTTQTDGHDRATFTFGVGTYSESSFEIDDHVKTVSPAEPSGAYGGGKSAVGGLDFEFVNIAGPANFKAEYLVEQREWTYAAEGDFDVEHKLRYQFANTSHDYLQEWHVSLLDNSDAAVNFDHVDLTLHYDESLIDNGANTLNDIENHLQAYQYNDVAGTWQPLQTLALQPWDDRLFVRATNLESPIVLGYDMNAASQPPNPPGEVGVSEMEIYRIEHPTEATFYIGNLEFQASGSNVGQATRIKVDRPNGESVTSTDDYGYLFIDDDPHTSLAALVAVNHGTYTIHIDYENNGSFDDSFTVTYDIDGLLDASLPDAPTITAPTSTTTVSAGEPTTFAWNFEPDADGIYVLVHDPKGPGLDDNEELVEDLTLAETTATFDANDLPTDKTLFGGVGATQTHHHLSSSTSATGTVHTELELVTFTTLDFSGSALHAAIASEPTVPAVRSDDTSQPPTTPESSGNGSLTEERLAPIVNEAISRFTTLGLTSEYLALLHTATFVVADLTGTQLGLQQGSVITLDTNAASHGWYIDDDPTTDTEFNSPTPTADPTHHLDLLTAIMHELGHVLGLDHTEDGLLRETLSLGERHEISDELVELLTAAHHDH